MMQIKNFTTKDWCIMMAYLVCCCFLTNWAFRSFFIDEEYVRGILHTLGAIGWVILYLNYMKKVEKKNE